MRCDRKRASGEGKRIGVSEKEGRSIHLSYTEDRPRNDNEYSDGDSDGDANV